MIRLRFITTDSFTSMAIRKFTWSPYSHVEMMIPNEGYLSSWIGEGVKIRPLNYDTKASKCDTGLVMCDDETSAKIIAAAKGQIGKPYDVMALAGFLVHRDWRQPTSWFCSELIEWSFEQGGYPLLHDLHVNRVTPGLLAQSPLIQGIAGLVR